jgi:hypothetical protein
VLKGAEVEVPEALEKIFDEIITEGDKRVQEAGAKADADAKAETAPEAAEAAEPERGLAQVTAERDALLEKLEKLAGKSGKWAEKRRAEIAMRLAKYDTGKDEENALFVLDYDVPEAPEQIAKAKRQYAEVVSRYTNPDGTKKAGWMKAPNGKDTKLTETQWVQVRTPLFKEWFGDWEAVAIQQQFEAVLADALNNDKIKVNDLQAKMFIREVSPEEIAFIKKHSGIDITGIRHEITAKELHHAIKNHGQVDEAAKHAGNRQLTEADIKLIPVILDAPTEIKVQPHGKNKASIVYGRDFGNGKIEYVERILETSQKKEPRLTMKTVWAVAIGVKPNTSAVYTPRHNSNVLFANGFVNPAEVSKVVDENSEPLVVYHGTGAVFDTFDIQQARQYSDVPAAFFFRRPRRGGGIRKCRGIFS